MATLSQERTRASDAAHRSTQLPGMLYTVTPLSTLILTCLQPRPPCTPLCHNTGPLSGGQSTFNKCARSTHPIEASSDGTNLAPRPVLHCTALHCTHCDCTMQQCRFCTVQQCRFCAVLMVSTSHHPVERPRPRQRPLRAECYCTFRERVGVRRSGTQRGLVVRMRARDPKSHRVWSYVSGYCRLQPPLLLYALVLIRGRSF